MPTFTREHINSGLYEARHSIEWALARATVDDDPDEYFRLVRGARAIDDQLADLKLAKYDSAKYTADDDDYQDEVAAQRASL